MVFSRENQLAVYYLDQSAHATNSPHQSKFIVDKRQPLVAVSENRPLVYHGGGMVGLSSQQHTCTVMYQNRASGASMCDAK